MKAKKPFISGLAGAGIFTALAASLCCITPLLALFSGAAGTTSAFSWMEPFRPYLIGITLLVLGLAWYLKFRPAKTQAAACDCEDENQKISFWQSKLFLGIVTAWTLLIMAFPYYEPVFYPDIQKEIVIVRQNNLQTIRLNVKGLTCQACNKHLENAMYQVPGVIHAKANDLSGKLQIEFDKSKTAEPNIIRAVNATGYKVSEDTSTKSPKRDKLQNHETH